MSLASTSTSRSTVRTDSRSRMTVEQKVATFAAQHAALTQELDSLDRISIELPNLESGLELLRASVSSAEARIVQGREQLRKEWRAHSESAGGQMPPLASFSRLKGNNDPARARLQHEYSVYQEAMGRWNTEENDLLELRQQQILAMQRVYEARDRIEPYGRLCAHLERMYEIVFEGEKLDSSEGQYFEWQVQCAKLDDQNMRGQLETAMTAVTTLTATHNSLNHIEAHLTSVEAMASRIPNWATQQNLMSRDDRLSSIGGWLGLMHKAYEKFKERSKQLKELPSRPIDLPELVFFPTQAMGGMVTIEGETVQARFPLGATTRSEEEMGELLRKCVASARYTLQMLEVERDGAQRRVDRLVAETSRVKEVLRTERHRRRALQRVIFERIAAENQLAAVVAATDSPSSRNSIHNFRTRRPLPEPWDPGPPPTAGLYSMGAFPSYAENDEPAQGLPPAYPGPSWTNRPPDSNEAMLRPPLPVPPQPTRSPVSSVSS